MLVMMSMAIGGCLMLSRDCDGCYRKRVDCSRRFISVKMGEKVFCPDGTAHLVDGGA
jgi:hypothetical protein